MRRHLPAILAVVAVPLLLFAVYGAPYLNYDASYSLVWAQDIANGYTPDYNGFIAPTPHPLQTFVSFLALPLGSSAYGFMAWVIMFAFGGLIWVIYRLGSELFNRSVGVVAALVIATRPAFDKNALAAYQDVPFVMFVLAALLLEVQRPRRGWPVLVLLTLAGLLRPEGWALAGLYFLYLAPKLDWNKRFLLGALAVSGPLLWALSDWAITGDPLHSFHGTQDLASQLDRPRSFGEAPGWTARFFGFTLREPLMIGVPIGIAFAWIYARRSALILLGMAGLMTAMFIGSTLVGLPLIARYVLTPAALLAIFYGAACFGWLNIDQLSARKRWRAVGLATLLLSVLFIPKHVLLVDEMRTKIDNYATIQGDLRVVSETPEFRAFYARCGRVSTTDHRPVPAFRFWVGGPPGSVQSAADPPHPWAQTAIFPRSLDVAKKFYNRSPNLTPPARMKYQQVLLTKHWRLLATPQCRAAVASGRTLPAADRS